MVPSSQLLYVADSKVLGTYNKFLWENYWESKLLSKITQNIQEYHDPWKKVTLERYIFCPRSQLPGQKIERYMAVIQ